MVVSYVNYDDFELHRPEDNLKNKSDVELEHFRSLVGANKKTGLYEAHGWSLNEDVDAYAKNLGLTDGTHFDYNDMAKKVGMENFDPNSASDKEELRDKLKDIQEHKLNEQKQNKSGSNASNVKNNYSKANSGREAVKNSSNKKNNKLSNKNGIDNDSNKLKKARKPILNKYKNNDNEEEKENNF